MKTIAEHCEFGIIGASFYWLKYSMILTPLILFCYTIYIEALLGNGLWKSAVGSGGLGVSIVLTILSLAASVVAILYYFNIVKVPFFKYIFNVLCVVALLFFCIDITFFDANSYFRSLKDVSEYCTRNYNNDPSATEWYTKYSSTNRYDAIDYVKVRTIAQFNALKTLLTVWAGSFFFVIVFDAFLNEKLEKQSVRKDM